MGDLTTREIAGYLCILAGTALAMAAGYVHGGLFECFTAGSTGMVVLGGTIGGVAKFGGSSTPKV